MTTNEKDTGFLKRVRTDHHRYNLRAVVGHCVFGAVDYCFCKFGRIGNYVKGVVYDDSILYRHTGRVRDCRYGSSG